MTYPRVRVTMGERAREILLTHSAETMPRGVLRDKLALAFGKSGEQVDSLIRDLVSREALQKSGCMISLGENRTLWTPLPLEVRHRQVLGAQRLLLKLAEKHGRSNLIVTLAQLLTALDAKYRRYLRLHDPEHEQLLIGEAL